MTREDVKKLFPEATDAQITDLLNKTNAEVAREKAKADKLKTEADNSKAALEEAAALQARIEELENEKLTEEQKRQKEEEKRRQEFDDKWKQMEQANIDLQNQLNSERIKSYAGSKNLTGDNIDTILKSFGSNYDLAVAAIDSMAQLIADKESAAALAKEQEIAKQSGNPGGQSGGGGNEKSSAVRLVERYYTGQSSNNDVLSHYVNLKGGK